MIEMRRLLSDLTCGGYRHIDFKAGWRCAARKRALLWGWGGVFGLLAAKARRLHAAAAEPNSHPSVPAHPLGTRPIVISGLDLSWTVVTAAAGHFAVR